MAGGVPCSGSGILLSSILHPPPSVDPRTGCCSLLHLVALGCTWLQLSGKKNGTGGAMRVPSHSIADCALRIGEREYARPTRVRVPDALGRNFAHFAIVGRKLGCRHCRPEN